MLLIDDFDANDDISMENNNTSSFNYRVVAGSSTLSNHALGMAIDINPLYNPYVYTKDGNLVVAPTSGYEYANRDVNNPYFIRSNDICYNAFVSRVFTWG